MSAPAVPPPGLLAAVAERIHREHLAQFGSQAPPVPADHCGQCAASAQTALHAIEAAGYVLARPVPAARLELARAALAGYRAGDHTVTGHASHLAFALAGLIEEPAADETPPAPGAQSSWAPSVHVIVWRGHGHDHLSVYCGPDPGHRAMCGMLACTRDEADHLTGLLDPLGYEVRRRDLEDPS